jgi:hypothetical protein
MLLCTYVRASRKEEHDEGIAVTSDEMRRYKESGEKKQHVRNRTRSPTVM